MMMMMLMLIWTPCLSLYCVGSVQHPATWLIRERICVALLARGPLSWAFSASWRDLIFPTACNNRIMWNNSNPHTTLLWEATTRASEHWLGCLIFAVRWRSTNCGKSLTRALCTVCMVSCTAIKAFTKPYSLATNDDGAAAVASCFAVSRWCVDGVPATSPFAIASPLTVFHFSCNSRSTRPTTWVPESARATGNWARCWSVRNWTITERLGAFECPLGLLLIRFCGTLADYKFLPFIKNCLWWRKRVLFFIFHTYW